MKIIIVGVGNRGGIYGNHAMEQGVEVAAIAERKPDRREKAMIRYHLSEAQCYAEADELLAQPKMADAAVISTLDGDHFGHAMAALEKGYDLLLEKPIAPTAQQCQAIARRANELGRKVAVCHVLRYAPLFTEMKRVIDEGRLGRVITIHHHESIGNFHMAHSYVRGNWRRKADTSPIIMAKSCHDLDLMVWYVGAKCRRVSSFGDLTYFKSENAPVGAAKRCFDCPHQDSCRFSVKHTYLPVRGQWPALPITADQSEEGLIKALKEGPYGRCVYFCDNDVCDHQVTLMEFENGVTVTFNLSAFGNRISRTTRVMCEHGEIALSEEDNTLTVTPYVSNSVYRSPSEVIHPASAGSGHGGGDARLLANFVDAIEHHTEARSDINQSVESHLIALAAEEARLTGQVIDMAEFRARNL